MFSYGVIASLMRVNVPALLPAQALLRTGALRYVGKISYGLYLYHYLILSLFGIAPFETETTGAGLTSVAEALVTTFLVASFSFRFIETPLLRVKDRLQARPRISNMRPVLSEAH
jgi:peptidoglycan/LPS O-acetylase OafA/YrhL